MFRHVEVYNLDSDQSENMSWVEFYIALIDSGLPFTSNRIGPHRYLITVVGYENNLSLGLHFKNAL